MKRFVLLLLILVLLPFSVDAGVKFETYNAADISWDIDTTCITLWDDFSDSISTSSAYLTMHDTTKEYIVGLDTVIILHRVECDTNFTKFFVENDSTFVQIEGITCDTIFRVDFRDVWIPKVQVWLDSLQWQKLMRILE